MLVEMRVYHCLPGRLPALMNRFRNSVLDLYKKHGFKPIGFFTTMIGESQQELTYFLSWDSLAERERLWSAFFSDPEWAAVRDASEKDGFIVDNTRNQILAPTDFSPMR
jgi:NIPSNAP